ncbi:DMT family transporter [Roseomonas sp. E05]|uniref:DMT family transporter n=1 Tax=Roseomonas sp. E05 TaxID=3046310 RepID=UPI0024BBBCD4|nr:DMT family transporter [Roseomonas sp. E05]MDJ0389881.1 DMT family transporter [Roseomonas sp. E05]
MPLPNLPTVSRIPFGTPAGPRWLVILLFLGAPLLFASNMVGARWLSGSVPPVTLAFGRWAVAGLLLLPLVWPHLRAGALRHASPGMLALLALLGGVASVAPQYGAARYTSAGNIALIAAMSPLLVAIIERVVWGVRLRPAMLAGIACAFCGIGVAAFRGDVAALLRFELNPGDALMFGAILAWAGYTALLRHRPVPLPPMLLVWVVATGGAAGLLPLVGLEWARMGVPALGAQAFWGMLFLGIVAGIGAYGAFARVVGMVGAAQASMSMYLVPAYALVLGAALLGESLHPYHAVAMALVLGGVALGTLRLPARAS